ncbi:pyroglutamyl-peptidase I [Citricoccus sp. GCM10030269]|uniref:pyroglutamyl-peptidase I n=1 Tax=Citricoccus sp. GCM10030269 TaxID=3273388 RepID=UPI00361514BB
MTSASRILLTGFEPFAGDGHNPSWPAAREAAARLRDGAFPGSSLNAAELAGAVEAVAVELPCSFTGSTEAFDRALADHRPDVVICCGLAGGRTEVAVERVALNLQDARIPDNDGYQPAGEPVDDAGPAAYFSTLPVKRTVAALKGAAIPAALSLSAGSFVCNHLFYVLMNRAPTVPLRSAGFVHVPWDHEHAPVSVPSLPAAQLTEALVITALEALRPTSDLTVAAGELH